MQTHRRARLLARTLARLAFVVALMLGVHADPAPANAQETNSAEPTEAARHIAQGEELFAAENFDAALAEFEAAHALLEGNAGRYLLLWNIGQCHERLFHYDRALDYYQRYLDEGGPEAEDRAAVEATMRALENLLATVELEVNVEGAEVWVDGHPVGTAPGTIRVTSGTHTVEVRASGHASEIREVQVAVRGTAHLDITLRVTSDYQGLEPWLFWATAGVGVLTAVIGGGVGIAAVVDSMNVQSFTTDARAEEDRQRIGSLSLAADVLYGIAGTFVITAVVLAFLTDWDGPAAGNGEAGPTAVFALPWVDGTSTGLSVGGRL
jgi:hypothetical protein